MTRLKTPRTAFLYHENCIWRAAAMGVPGLPNCTQLGRELTAERDAMAQQLTSLGAARRPASGDGRGPSAAEAMQRGFQEQLRKRLGQVQSAKEAEVRALSKDLAAAKSEAAAYQKLLALRQKEAREKKAEKMSQRRSQRSSQRQLRHGASHHRLQRL